VEEWNVSNFPNSLSSQRDNDCVDGVKEYLALHHPEYKWVDPRVKLPLSRFKRSYVIVVLCKRVEMIADTVNEHIVSIE